MKEKEDRRISKSKRAIMGAFKKLLAEYKGLSRISVKVICDEADISRGTFYLHYKDVYDLMEAFENELITEFMVAVQRHSPEVLEGLFYPLIYEIITFADENKDIAAIMLDPDGDSKLGTKIRESLEDKFIENFRQMYPDKKDAPVEYYYDFIFGGSLAVIFHWFNHRHEESKEEIATIIERMIIEGVHYNK